MTLHLPPGWVVAEIDTFKLSLATAPFGAPDATTPPPGLGRELQAAVFFTHERDPTPDAWRQLVGEQRGVIDEDVEVTVDKERGTRIVFSNPALGTPLREMVIVLPDRDLVVLFQPIVARGAQNGPEVFDRYRVTFDTIVSSIRFGPPTKVPSA